MVKNIKRLLILVLFAAMANSSFSQSAKDDVLVNGDFETWVDGEPVNWHTVASATGDYGGLVSNQVSQSERTRPGSKGKYSALVRPKSVFGVIANGSLTCGRFNAGSMKSSNHEENYSYTQREEKSFNIPINSIPDSIVAWVCFRSKSPDSQANFVSVVHGDVNFSYSGPDYCRPEDQMCAMSGPCFIPQTSPAKSDEYVWRRVSVPFVKKHDDVKPAYILVLFSTNRLAAEGSSKDELYIDDVELIYNK